ncbi:SDR family NAD(P)-dependent oxidoreductase [Sorangium sp. So ce1128]
MAEIMIVTGGSRGIGAATALLAASRGYAVAVSYLRDAGAAAKMVDEIRARGGRAVAVAADVRVRAEPEDQPPRPAARRRAARGRERVDAASRERLHEGHRSGSAASARRSPSRRRRSLRQEL